MSTFVINKKALHYSQALKRRSITGPSYYLGKSPGKTFFDFIISNERSNQTVFKSIILDNGYFCLRNKWWNWIQIFVYK